MGKIIKYAKTSSLMDIDITWNGERFKFDLYQEIRIDADRITKEALIQPNAFAFLSMLHKKLVKKVAELETQCKRVYAQVYVKVKDQNNPKTGRPYSDDMCKEKVILNKKFQKAEDMLEAARADEQLIFSAVKAFEQRLYLIQTISANTRKEIN